MPRAGRFSRSDVEQRPEAVQDDPVLIERLVQEAGIADPAERECCQHELAWTIRHYRERVLADEQERPARIVAALKPGLKPAGSLSAWLNSLPVGVLIELRAGNIQTSLEALIPRIENRVAYWQRRVAAHRPAGEGARNRELRRSLTDIITAHWPDPPDATDRQKRINRLKRDRWVAFACREIGARYPNEKKNRRRFIG
jgi:hypothetical protein